jgi:hypothetical protein
MTSKCDSFQDRDPASGPSYDFAGSAPDGHVTSTQSEALGEGNDPASGADSPASEPEEFPIMWLRCANCERATTTGLCGCPNPAPEKIGEGVMRVSNQESKP